MENLTFSKLVKFTPRFTSKSFFALFIMVALTLFFQSCTTDDLEVQQAKSISYEHFRQKNDTIIETPSIPIPPIPIEDIIPPKYPPLKKP